MTIIGTVHTDDAAWIASDSLHIHPMAEYGSYNDKLFRYKDQQIAWGWFGGSDQGDTVALYVNNNLNTLATWDHLSYHLENTIRMLDMGAGGMRFGAVFAGRTQDGFGSRVYAREPVTADAAGITATFVGTGKVPAKVGWNLTAHITDPEERLRRVVSTVIEACHPWLEGPLQLWRITEDFCGPVDAAPYPNR